ncbi:aminoglycoside phosphotransferase (APT) family kinase protein [Okibacterium sp. HSC-33S16]|uniref:aminoglycoside phosphotransferase family protein n=1 Tax=Okibacterium sp. HSC-33S16 TaxID=2910965 RepID=UPI00209DD910|nr:aminoglycoside phosphotransferase family protein [Okibacterium sp. HSC-33S16]MCP2030622.1 aminoglycoside phosphotransferase (APT) family kinase protein [Okibacterium sp. HSC-33S16]
MARSPAAEVDISPELIRRLLRAQHPELADLPLTLVAHGWDNAMYRLGEQLVVRLPRRQLAAALIENEQRWLPEIADRVDVAVPRPIYFGRPTVDFPWHWSIARWFDGAAASTLPIDKRGRLASPLATFLTQLHTAAPADAPVNNFRGIPLERRHRDVRSRLNSGIVPHADAVSRIWDDARTAPLWERPRVWLHGDLHPSNLLVDSNGDLAAVLDFGDITAGDPATDLAAAWLVFDPAGRDRFHSAVAEARDVSDATWRRARGWALVLATALVTTSDDSPSHRRMGEQIIDQLLLD